MEAPRLTISLIGHGRWGRCYEETFKSAFPSVKLKICESREVDWRPFFKNADGVIIATPPDAHKEMVLQGIADGVPLLVEKPLTLSASDDEEIWAASESSMKANVMIGFTQLYSAGFQKILQMSKGKKLCQADLHMTAPGPVRKWAHPAIHLWDWAPHPLSQAITILGPDDRIKKIIGQRGTLLDMSHSECWKIVALSEKGVVINIKSGLHTSKINRSVFYFEDQMYDWNGLKGDLHLYLPDEAPWKVPMEIEEISPLENQILVFLKRCKGERARDALDVAISCKISRLLEEIQFDQSQQSPKEDLS